MAVSRRRVLQIAALGAAAAGCSAGGGRGLGQPSPAGSTESAATSSPTSSPGAPAASQHSGHRRIAPEVRHGARSGSAVALTFHGAGDPSIARSVIRVLGHFGVQVTVLAVGTWLESQPSMATMVLDAGHELGNHTQHHLPMRGLDADTVRREIIECAHTLRGLTGSPGRWFRASGIHRTTPVIRAAAAKAGYPRCLSYDLDSLDWTDPGPDAIAHTVLSRARAGTIVSLHLGHVGTVQALPRLLTGLRTMGLRPVTVSELVG